MAQVPYHEIRLPLPTSVNAMHTVSKGFRCPKTGKWRRTQTRSSEYSGWIQEAAVIYRNTFPGGVQKFKGRLRVDYIFVWNEADKGRNSSDISNREKCLSDFLEHKFYQNDNQIDEQHHYRRIRADYESCVILRVYEIPDRRYDDPMLIFSV
jgi:Holliday junction resolvase RusA-like endonuclease